MVHVRSSLFSVLHGLCVAAAISHAQPAPADLSGLRLGTASAPATSEPLASVRALAPQQQRARAAEHVSQLSSRPSRTAAENELNTVLGLYTVTRLDELREASATLDAALDDARPWAAEGLRARRLLRLADQLAHGAPAAKAATLQELDTLFREALRGGPLGATTLCVTLDAVQTHAWALAESVPPAELARRINGWVESFVPVFPNDATALRRAAQLHAKLGVIARWKDDAPTATDQAARGGELDGALIAVATAPSHDLLMAAQHRLWKGDVAGARALVLKLEGRPLPTRFAGSGSAERVRDDWIRFGLLYHAIGAAESDASRKARQQAIATLPARPNLAEAVLQTPDAASVVLDTELTILEIRHDQRRLGLARDALFLARLQQAVAKLVFLANVEPLPLSKLLAACVSGSRRGVNEAAEELARDLPMKALTSRWFVNEAKHHEATKARLAGLAEAEKALLHWVAREPHNGAFERDTAALVINALHRGLVAAVAQTHTMRFGDPGFAAATTLPLFGVSAAQGETRPIMPAPFAASWSALQFELCIGFLDAVALTSKVDGFKAHHATAATLQRLAAKLDPTRGQDLVAVTTHFNAQMRKAEEAAAAAREARLAEERRRAEQARLAREAAETESRRQAQAAQQAQASQAQAAAQPRFRWCMRCAGTGTYAQYVDETNYGRTSRVQKQVRCDRCYGSGKLP
ncbi:hypothetical protein [Horticoccus sp. 23ND18S-11]|uniref:hypothetical protein n=1 Tax=Horticoccus sp. 23ND18S-11 TaxID=3391832 RepID=UPI0039C91B8C